LWVQVEPRADTSGATLDIGQGLEDENKLFGLPEDEMPVITRHVGWVKLMPVEFVVDPVATAYPT
jgi:hypothetical protein